MSDQYIPSYELIAMTVGESTHSFMNELLLPPVAASMVERLALLPSKQ